MMKNILYDQITKLFRDTEAIVQKSRVDPNVGEGLFINISSEGTKYNHNGNEYFTKSEFLAVEASVHLVENYEVILDKVAETIVKEVFTNPIILENLEEVPQVEVLPTDLDSLGETNRAMVEINVVFNQATTLNPNHIHVLNSINLEVSPTELEDEHNPVYTETIYPE